eukprot:7377340-Prymnesium_polylepis.4
MGRSSSPWAVTMTVMRRAVTMMVMRRAAPIIAPAAAARVPKAALVVARAEQVAEMEAVRRAGRVATLHNSRRSRRRRRIQCT